MLQIHLHSIHFSQKNYTNLDSRSRYSIGIYKNKTKKKQKTNKNSTKKRICNNKTVILNHDRTSSKISKDGQRRWRKNLLRILNTMICQAKCGSFRGLIYNGTVTHELPWDLTDEIDCADTDAVGLLRSRSPLMPFGFPLSLSIASWHTSLNQSSSGSTLKAKFNSASTKTDFSS